MLRRVEGGLLVVRRPFKSGGILYNVGTVIEDPTVIKTFRSRFSDRDIIEMLPGQVEVNQSWLPFMEARATEAIDSRVYDIAEMLAPEKGIDNPATDVPSADENPTGTKLDEEIAKAGSAELPKTVTPKVVKPLSSSK